MLTPLLRTTGLLGAFIACASGTCAAVGASAADLAAAPGVEIVSGAIDGARFQILKPVEWNGNLLLHAHGFRAGNAPLQARLDPSAESHARLLEEGWMLATSSYRRNGIILRDAIADLNALRDHIERTEGEPRLVLLLGESMGGTIVTIIAENEPDRYHGALAIDAGLELRDPVYPLALTHEPKIPVLFLNTRTEVQGTAQYVEQAAQAPVRPALWTVNRDGHVNVNETERTLAIDGLIAWITSNQIDRRRDATAGAGNMSSTARLQDGALHGAAWRLTRNYGNVFSTFVPADFERLGIQPGERFELTAGDRPWTVLYGTDYGDVPPGEWVAFPRAEGVILIARNRENAAATAGLAEGDPLIVRPLPDDN